MRKTFQYRLYPTKTQKTAMQDSLSACCWVYNKTLETRKIAWEQEQCSVSLYDTHKLLAGWKQEEPWLGQQAFSQSLQEACTRVDLAFQAFFRRVKRGETPGYPRFKSRNRYKSFTYTQSGFKLFDNDKLLYLSKIGHVNIKLHRPVKGRVKTLTIRHDGLGKWWASFSCIVEPKPLPVSSNVIGVDVGLTHFATLSTGEKIDNPRFFKRDEKALLKARSQRDKAPKGSTRRKQLARRVNHIDQRIKNRRKDFAHKLSRELVNKYQIIAFEDLDIPDMMNNNWRSMNKSIADAAWGQFFRFTEAKAVEAGRTVVKDDPRGTTQDCSGCGETVPKDLSVRIHDCPHCGLVLDRDHNAALNILARGLSCLGVNP